MHVSINRLFPYELPADQGRNTNQAVHGKIDCLLALLYTIMRS